MKEVLICVPSKGRAKIFKRKTLKFLHFTRLPWKIFVEPQDEHDYQREMRGFFKDRAVILPEDDAGLGLSLRTARQYARAEGYQFVWKMDDDIHHWYDSGRVVKKQLQGRMLDLGELILLDALNELGSRLGGISFGGHYMHTDWSNFTHVNKMFETTYIVRSSAWNVPEIMCGYHEEFVATASLVRRGFVVPRTGRLCWAADLSGFDGGLQSFDRVKEQNYYFRVMQEHLPKLAAMTQRQMYKQKSGKTWAVTDKRYFNRQYSTKLKDGMSLSDFLTPSVED